MRIPNLTVRSKMGKLPENMAVRVFFPMRNARSSFANGRSMEKVSPA